MDSSQLSLILTWYLIFVFSVVFHEAAHALAAMKLGDLTAYHGGQVTLNPTPHIRREPFGMIVIPALSFFFIGWMVGWASTPYDPRWGYYYPRRAALMALAGPSANLLLVLVAALIIRVGMFAGVFYAPETISLTQVTAAASPGYIPLALMVSILFTLNLVLLIFNLFPLPPLDGSGILPLFMPAESANRYSAMIRQPAFAIVGLIVVWNLFTRFFPPIHLFALNLLYPGAGYH